MCLSLPRCACQKSSFNRSVPSCDVQGPLLLPAFSFLYLSIIRAWKNKAPMPLFQEVPDQYHQSIHLPCSHPPHVLSLHLSPSFSSFTSLPPSLSLFLSLSYSRSLSLSLSLSVAAAVSISSWQKGTLWINDTELLKVQILNNEFHHQKHNNFSNHKIALPFHIDCACATRCREHSLHPCKVEDHTGRKCIKW